MTALIIILCIILITVVLVQIGRVTELTTQIKGEREVPCATAANGMVWFQSVSGSFPCRCVLVGLPLQKRYAGLRTRKSASATRECPGRHV
jgi:hypothetical protein